MPVESYEEIELLSDGTKKSQGFRLIKKEEDLVFRSLFQASETQTELSKFSHVIPEDAQDCALKWFEQVKPQKYRFVLLYPETVTPDPVLLAEVADPKYDWFNMQRTYIIARWGEALESFKVLHGRAIAEARATIKRRISMARRQSEMELAALKDGDIDDNSLLERARSENYGKYNSVL